MEFSLVCIFVKSSLRVEQFNKVLDVSRASLVIKYDVLGDAKAYRRRMAYLEHATPKANVVSFMTTEYDRAVLRNVQECYKIPIHKYTDAVSFFRDLRLLPRLLPRLPQRNIKDTSPSGTCQVSFFSLSSEPSKTTEPSTTTEPSKTTELCKTTGT